MSKFTAIVLSGGTGKRMQSDIPKQYLILKDKPVLAHSLLAFEESKVDDIVIVCGAGDEDYIRKEFVLKYGLSKVSA
ncbi:MAG: 2-C-methyl-D-erythritol 4-phosphate cytidylyltransferase, partial [Lachnospiraceae bacterium]|nr:2-C-methyl-D-erythritol 4-phosphate cytidylyltransferase [Lachnospiraceae bacterium]